MSFVIENGGNTCYIDSVLMAMFYFKSNIERILDREPEAGEKHADVLMLQEYIKGMFVQPIREKVSVLGDSMNVLRNLFFQAGWLGHLPEELVAEEMFNQQDISEFYNFIIGQWRGPTIKFNVTTTIGNEQQTKSDELPFIALSIPQDKWESVVEVKDLLVNFMSESAKQYVKDGVDVNAIDKYSIENIPEYIALSINRFYSMDKRNYTKVNINTSISPFKSLVDSDIRDVKYYIHAAICFRGETPHAGHYYAILHNKETKNGTEIDKWYKFDDLVEPCLSEINMGDTGLINEIASQVTFLLYKSLL